MPLLWKLLISRFLKTTLFCSISLIFISMIGSLQEIVSLIAKNVPYTTVLKLTAYQIPYLLPFIIPVSCFVSAFSLFRKFSDNNQLIFLKSSGASQGLIIFPLLVTSAIVGCLNFYTCSELASICRYKTCKAIADIAMTSPALLLQSVQKNEVDRIFISVDNCNRNTFNDVIVAFRREGEISDVGIIRSIVPDIHKDTVSANDVLLLSKLPSTSKEKTESTDSQDVYIETVQNILIPKVTSTLFSGKSYLKTKTDYLTWRKLIRKVRKDEDHQEFLAEIFRRVSIGTLCITLTYAGIVLGTYKPRFRKKASSIFFSIPILIITLLIIGKNTKSPWLASLLFLAPQGASWGIFSLKAYRESRGYA